MNETSNTTTETSDNIDHVVESLIGQSDCSDTAQQEEQASRESGERPADQGDDLREGAEKSSPCRTSNRAGEISRMIDQADTALGELERKIENGRVRDADKERVRVQWISTLSTMLRTKRQLIEAEQIDELADRVTKLEDEVKR